MTSLCDHGPNITSCGRFRPREGVIEIEITSRCTCHLGTECPIHGLNPRTRDCSLCGKPIADTPWETASDGEIVHERCEDEYENILYFRELQDDSDV